PPLLEERTGQGQAGRVPDALHGANDADPAIRTGHAVPDGEDVSEPRRPLTPYPSPPGGEGQGRGGRPRPPVRLPGPGRDPDRPPAVGGHGGIATNRLARLRGPQQREDQGSAAAG